MAIQNKRPVLMWFRRDLRLSDNPALRAACSSGCPVICVYIHDIKSPKLRPDGAASLWWLDKSLRALSRQIEAAGGQLILRSGASLPELRKLVTETDAAGVFWNRRYGEAERALDIKIKADLIEAGISAESFNGSLLTEPWTIKSGSGGYYRVFSPYWRAVQACYTPHEYLEPPKQLHTVEISSDSINDWALHPSNPDWSTAFSPEWEPGEQGAQAQLDNFLNCSVNTYKEHRNRPDLANGTSRLSPHLRFGEISPVSIWRSTMSRIQAGAIDETNAKVFLSEVGWREFSYALLFYNPQLAEENYNPNFAHMEWTTDESLLSAWQKGQTGYPIVDAGMRELWTTGWMHNRVRMIVASFLTKHLLQHWAAGEKWFWDTLVDACPAANAASWQWTAGSGADAAPYFRVFNPITQGEKFDESGEYVKRWCPELARLPRKFLYSPWNAPELVLQESGIVLGKTYPRPIVDHKMGRERALSAYQTMKERRDAA